MVQHLVAAVGTAMSVAGAVVTIVYVPWLIARRKTYELPRFVATTLAAQPSPPRQAPITRVGRALFRGIDWAIYIAAGLFFIGFGLVFASSPKSRSGGLVFLIVGLLSLALALFRTWQVNRALRLGDAEIVQVTEAETGRARLGGTPWGDLITGSAARGRYRFASTGEAGRYYMQQSWALSLRPGDRLWVLRRRGRDVLYAPAPPGTT